MEGIGRRLKEAREKKKLSITEVAGRVGLSISTISRYESEERKLSLGIASKFSKIYGLSSEHFLFGEEEPEIRTSFRAREDKSQYDLEVVDWADSFIRDLYQVMNMSK